MSDDDTEGSDGWQWGISGDRVDGADGSRDDADEPRGGADEPRDDDWARDDDGGIQDDGVQEDADGSRDDDAGEFRIGGADDGTVPPLRRPIEPGDPDLENAAFVLLGVLLILFVLYRLVTVLGG